MKKDALAILIVGAVIAGFAYDAWLFGESPNRGDIPLQFYPWKHYARTMLGNGEIPYWNPYTFAGAPFLANMQSAVFYPFDLLLFVFPMEFFFGLSFLLHLLLAGVGAYLLARMCEVSQFPSILAGVAYGLNGFTMIHLPAGNHLTYAGAAWIPWLLWATAGFARTNRSRLPWAMAVSGITLFHFLCGHPQMTFYSLVFGFVFSLSYGFWLERRKEYVNYYVPPLRTMAWTMFAVFGLCVASFQLLATLEYLGQANRGAALDLQMATEFSFAPHRLITLFCPEYYGTFIAGNHYDSFVFWSCAYAGAMVPLLAFAAWWARLRYLAVVPLLALTVLGLLLAWGRGNPFYALVFQLPGFGHFRAPAKFLPYYLVSVCVLASIGIDWLSIKAYELQQRIERPPTAAPVGTLSILLVILLTFGIPWITQLTDLIRKTDGIEAADWIQRLSLARGAVLLIAAFTAYTIARKVPKSPRFAISAALLVVLCIDLFTYGRGYVNACFQPAEIVRARAYPPREVEFLQSRNRLDSTDRVLTLADLDYPNLAIGWGIHNIAGYDPMSLRSYNELVGSMEGWEPGSFHDNIQIKTVDHPVLDRLNARYVLSRLPMDNPAARRIHTAGEFIVYERTQPGRAWAASRNESGEWINADARITVETYRPHEIVFRYHGEPDAILRISEWDYPGWRAKATLADGRVAAVKIERSEEGFRMLRLPADTETVRIEYRSPWGRWILSVCFMMLFLLLCGCAVISRTDRYLYLIQRLMGRDY